MESKHDYQRIAKRSLLACDAVITSGIHEKAAFLAYHAFESTGCAFLIHQGDFGVGKNVSHANKIEKFKISAQKSGNTKLAHAVMQLHYRLQNPNPNLRNKLLYPEIDRVTGNIRMPEQQITPNDVCELRDQVEIVFNLVERIVKTK